MHLLIIGSDRNLFKKDSDVRNRYLDYGKLFEEIHVIVFSAKRLGNKNVKIGDNVFVHPTDHICKIFYLWNIYQISKQIFKIIVIPAKAGIQVGNWIPHQVRNDRKVVVSSQDPFEAGLAGWILKKIYKIPLQIQIHTDFLSPYFRKESLMNKFRVSLAKFLIPRADSVRVVSERIKNSLIRNWKLDIRNLKIDVLPIFVDTQLIKNTPIKTDLHKKYSQFDFIILMASRLTKEKNIGLAIEAMAELIKKYPKLGLVIVGSGPERETLQKLIVKSQLLNVVIEPFVAQDILFSYYKTADLFLLTSNYEGYGRSVIEAIAAGLLVVMTDVGLAGEAVINGKNGVVVPVGDSNAVVDSISSLIAEEGKRGVLSASAIKTIEKITTKEHYLELYKQSIESRGLKD